MEAESLRRADPPHPPPPPSISISAINLRIFRQHRHAGLMAVWPCGRADQGSATNTRHCRCRGAPGAGALPGLHLDCRDYAHHLENSETVNYITNYLNADNEHVKINKLKEIGKISSPL